MWQGDIVVKYNFLDFTAQKMKYSIKDFFSIYDKIHNLLRIWSHLLKRLLMEVFIFCAVLDLRFKVWQ